MSEPTTTPTPAPGPVLLTVTRDAAVNFRRPTTLSMEQIEQRLSRHGFNDGDEANVNWEQASTNVYDNVELCVISQIQPVGDSPRMDEVVLATWTEETGWVRLRDPKPLVVSPAEGV